MPRYSKKDIADARENLLRWIKPGDTVYTICDHVSRSGMRRHIRVLVPYTHEAERYIVARHTADTCPGRPCGSDCDHVEYTERRGTIDFIHPNYATAVLTGSSQAMRNGHRQDGIIVDGCGMDMGFSLVYSLSHTLYPEYTCIGENCPSPEHGNNMRRETCECGHEKYHHEVLEREGWHEVRGKCEQVDCTCAAFNKIPNVDHRGPGVIHRDGYALRHRWL